MKELKLLDIKTDLKSIFDDSFDHVLEDSLTVLMKNEDFLNEQKKIASSGSNPLIRIRIDLECTRSDE